MKHVKQVEVGGTWHFVERLIKHKEHSYVQPSAFSLPKMHVAVK